MYNLMKKTVAVLFPLLLILTLGLAACGQTSNGSGGGAQGGASANEVEMGVANFVQSSVTIEKGQSVHFVVQQSGAAHILCTGKNGQCDTGASASKDLDSPGFTIQPGESHDVRFDNAGTYAVTCTLHPMMNLVITVR